MFILQSSKIVCCSVIKNIFVIKLTSTFLYVIILAYQHTKAFYKEVFMKKNLKITPEGMKDFLFAECSAMDDVCGKIEKVFIKGGFKKVITPGIEFYLIRHKLYN